jgi:NTE family protein
VGALRALLESGFQPDLLVGTSIGSVNAAFLALNGFSAESLDRMAVAWEQAAGMDLLPTNYFWLTLRSMLRGFPTDPAHRIREFLIGYGLTPELRFADLTHPRLVIVSSDLNTGQPVLHGDSPEDMVLDGLLLSTALPPWVMPVRKQDRYLMDGAVVSNLPVEPALRMGATGIIALDLADTRDTPGLGDALTSFVEKLSTAAGKRETDLELELAAARGIPTLYIGLVGTPAVPIWDFRHTPELIRQGYEITRRVIENQPLLRSILLTPVSP